MRPLLVVLVIATMVAKADREFTRRPSRPKMKITGGKEATPHKFPFQVLLLIDKNSMCGGSIIDAKNVLSAAHCCVGAKSIKVIAGAHNIKIKESTQQSVISTTFKVHERYDSYTILNDVCIVKLPTKLNLNNVTVASIPLYRWNDNLVGRKVVVSGWGVTSDINRTISPTLQYTEQYVMSNLFCKIVYFNIERTHICAYGYNASSSCNGDSGGPLISLIHGYIQQVGIVSFGSALGCEKGFPSAYTRVSSYFRWIDSNKS